MILKNGQIFYNRKFQNGNIVMENNTITEVDFEGKYMRHDIGQRALTIMEG